MTQTVAENKKGINIMIKAFQEIIDSSNNIVFFGGAGVSTESGIPDFRGQNGLYNQKRDDGRSPEDMLTRTFFFDHTEEFFDFYRQIINCQNAQPNATHTKLAELEKAGKLSGVITQNIDGLHQKAGSENVLELHGTIRDNICLTCGKHHDADYVLNKTTGVPKCECGGIVKPNVVLYEESLNTNTLYDAANLIRNADVLIVGGTSLTVMPASSLLRHFNGRHLVIINKQPTPWDHRASLVIRDNIGEVFEQIRVHD